MPTGDFQPFWSIQLPQQYLPYTTSIDTKQAYSNIVGGSLDGASIPDGTRDGQKLTWSEEKKRWLGH